MQLYNKSKRTFTVKHPEPTEQNKGTLEVKPESLFTVSDEEGGKLLNLYKNEIIKAGDKQEVKNLEDELLIAYEKIQSLEEEIKTLKTNKKTAKK